MTAFSSTITYSITDIATRQHRFPCESLIPPWNWQRQSSRQSSQFESTSHALTSRVYVNRHHTRAQMYHAEKKHIENWQRHRWISPVNVFLFFYFYFFFPFFFFLFLKRAMKEEKGRKRRRENERGTKLADSLNEHESTPAADPHPSRRPTSGPLLRAFSRNWI